jgi:hypothetical protein
MFVNFVGERWEREIYVCNNETVCLIPIKCLVFRTMLTKKL